MSELLAALKPSGKRVDKVEEAFWKCDEREREAIAQALADPSFTASDIARALNVIPGVEVASAQVVHYRKKIREGKVSL